VTNHFDFAGCKAGAVVKRSPYFNRKYGRKGKDTPLGIVTELEFFPAERGVDPKFYGKGLIAFPVIHWEGQPAPQITHPSCAVLYRKTP
jgi:hypothetical protein